MKNVIFSYYQSSEIFDVFLKDFIMSLRLAAKFEDDIVIFHDDDISQNLATSLDKYSPIFVRVAKSEYRITSYRFDCILSYLQEHKYENVIVADLDIWFQDSLVEFISAFDKGITFTKNGYIRFKNNQFSIAFASGAKGHIAEYSKRFIEIAEETNAFINLGFFGGKYLAVVEKLEKFIDFDYTEFSAGGDQIIMTMLFDFDNDAILKTQKFNYLSKMPYKNIDGVLYTYHNEKVVGYHLVGSTRECSSNYFHLLHETLT